VILIAPREEAKVDHGSGPTVRDPESRKYRWMRLIVMTLGYSRKSVRPLTWCSSTRVRAELHEQVFRRLGRAVRAAMLGASCFSANYASFIGSFRAGSVMASIFTA
jgi:hypothetical protein